MSGLRHSDSSSIMRTTSISGLPGAEPEEEGVSIAGNVDSSDSTLFLVPISSPSYAIFEGVVGEGGDEEIVSRGATRRFRVVILPELGS